jgi:hypothetical protein
MNAALLASITSLVSGLILLVVSRVLIGRAEPTPPASLFGLRIAGSVLFAVGLAAFLMWGVIRLIEAAA